MSNRRSSKDREVHGAPPAKRRRYSNTATQPRVAQSARIPAQPRVESSNNHSAMAAPPSHPIVASAAVVEPSSDLTSMTLSSSNFECPVCFDEFSGKIFQCRGGHVVCEECFPELQSCPICQSTLKDKIRNRALEGLLEERNSVVCPLKCFGCHCKNRNRELMIAHLQQCSYRIVRCNFKACLWIGTFANYESHLVHSHHTSLSSTQSRKDNSETYEFTHAIKVPVTAISGIDLHSQSQPRPATSSKHNQRSQNGNSSGGNTAADYMWPKVYSFKNGQKFFVLTRFHENKIMVFVRKFSLPLLSRQRCDAVTKLCIKQSESFSRYYSQILSHINDDSDTSTKIVADCSRALQPFFTESDQNFTELSRLPANRGECDIQLLEKIESTSNQSKNKNKNKNKSDGNDQNISQGTTKTRVCWPAVLYDIQPGFEYENTNGESLQLTPAVFSRFWTRKDTNSSAVLRFRFVATED